MKKILLFILLVCAGFIAQSQTRDYYVEAIEVLQTDSLLVINDDTFNLNGSSNGQILQKVAGQWVNADPSYVDSLFKSENVLFTNASNDSVSSQLAIKTYVLQSIMDSVGAGVSITDDQVAVGTGTGIEGTSGLTYDGSTLGVTGNVDVSNDIFSRNDTIYHGTARILSGTSEDKQDIYLTVSGGNVYFEVEKTGGGDIEYIFGKGSEYDLDCTTGAGVGGRARVILTEGTTASYIRNYVYVTHAGGVAVLNASTSMPTGEFAWVGMATIQSDTDVTADGALQFQSMDESFYGTDLRGQLSKMREKLRWIGAEYINDGGILQTFTITEGTPDVGVLTTTAGQVYQLHRNTWSSYNMATDGLYIANASGAGVLTKNQKITDINTIRETSDGTVIVNNDRVVFTIWGTMNSMGEQKMWLNLPTDVYANNSTALQDRFNYSVTTAPKEFQTTAFLVCKLVLRYNNTGQWINLVGGTAVQDLRGVPMGYNLGGSTSTTTQSFSDADFELYYDSDASAILTYDASAITTGTERVFKIPDHNINFDGLVLDASDSLVNGNTVYDFVTDAISDTIDIYKTIIAIEGDSRTANPSPTNIFWPTYADTLSELFRNADVYNYALGARTVVNMTANYETRAGVVAPTGKKIGYFIVYGGANDIGGTIPTVQVVYDSLQVLWQKARDDGYYVVASTETGANIGWSATQELQKDTLNTLIRGDRTLYDYLLEPDIFIPLTEATYYSDGIHLTDLGSKEFARMVTTILSSSTRNNNEYFINRNENISGYSIETTGDADFGGVSTSTTGTSPFLRA